MPPVHEPTATLTPPAPIFRFTDAVAIDGDYAVVGYAMEDFDPESDDYTFDRLPVIYRRNTDGSAPNVSVGNWYELRLEAIQNQLRVYVGNQLILEATDATFSEGVDSVP